MEVAALGADGLGDLAHERDHVVVGGLLDLGDAVDVDPGAVLDDRRARPAGRGPGGPARGRRRAPRRASARSGPGRSRPRPSRAACSAGSSPGPRRSRASARPRRCRGAAGRPRTSTASAARSARSRRRREVRALAHDRQHAAAVRPEAALGRRRATVPAWKTSAPPAAVVEALDRVAAARVAGVAAGREHDRHGGARRGPGAATGPSPGCAPRARRAGAGPAARRGGAGSPASRGRRAGRWSRAGRGPSAREHQARVEEAPERGPAAGHLGEDRAGGPSRATASTAASSRSGSGE